MANNAFVAHIYHKVHTQLTQGIRSQAFFKRQFEISFMNEMFEFH